jgi:hypothetical protein
MNDTHRIVASGLTCLFVAARAVAALPVLPNESAHLYGMSTPAGSGRHLPSASTRIVRVTNLNDAGPGSLRDALEIQSGPRTVIFEVSGNIPLESPIVIGSGRDDDTKGRYLTIAGQTAPAPGITIMHYGLRIEQNCHDILIQHLRIRPGDTSIGGFLKDGWTAVDGPKPDSVYSHPVKRRPNRGWGFKVGVSWNGATLKEAAGKAKAVGSNEWDWKDGVLYANVGGNPAKGELIWIPNKTDISDPLTVSDKLPVAYNLVVDHCSFSWGGDMTVQNGADRASFLNNILTESLAHPRHPKGPHSKGFYNLAYNRGEGGQQVALVRNMISHSVDRNPAISSGSAIVVNNFLYDLGNDEVPGGRPGRDLGIRGEDTDQKKGAVIISIVANVVERSDRAPSVYPICFRSRWEHASKFYVSEDNLVDGKAINDPWKNPLVSQQSPWPKRGPVPQVKRAGSKEEAIWAAGFQPMPGAQVKAHVLRNVGARPADRDPVDQRIIRNVHDRVAHIIVSQDDVGGWPKLAEIRRPLSPPANPNADDNGDGYTNLENWLHGYAAQVEGRAKQATARAK